MGRLEDVKRLESKEDYRIELNGWVFLHTDGEYEVTQKEDGSSVTLRGNDIWSIVLLDKDEIIIVLEYDDFDDGNLVDSIEIAVFEMKISV